MDINKLINIARSVPKEKLKTDAGLREVIRDISRQAGKNLSSREIDMYTETFRKMSRTESVGSLMNKLSKKGVKDSDLDKIKKRFKK